MDAPEMAAFDQLTGVVAQIRETAALHFRMLTCNGVPPTTAGEMAAEVQSTLLEALFPGDSDDE